MAHDSCFLSRPNWHFCMNKLIEALNHHTDITDLRPALYTLCSRFGLITRLDVLASSQVGKHQALCFLRMDSEEHEQRLVEELGFGRFGGDLVVVVDLQSGSPSKPSSLS